MGEEAGEGVAQGGEGRGGGGKPGFEPGAKAAHLEVVKAEAGRLHFLLASPFCPPVLKPDLRGQKREEFRIKFQKHTKALKNLKGEQLRESPLLELLNNLWGLKYIGLSYRLARLHSLAELVPWNRFGSWYC